MTRLGFLISPFPSFDERSFLNLLFSLVQVVTSGGVSMTFFLPSRPLLSYPYWLFPLSLVGREFPPFLLRATPHCVFSLSFYRVKLPP